MSKLVEKMAHIRVSDMSEFIEDTYLAGGNILFLALPGIGKTEIIQSTAKSLIEKYLKGDSKENAFQFIDGSAMNEEGLMMPYVNLAEADKENGQVLQKDMVRPLKDTLKWMDENDEEEKMIFFIDEFSSFSQDDQRTLMNMIQSGIMPDGSVFNQDRMVVVMAGNPSQDMPGYEEYDGNTHPIEEAVITRMTTMFVSPDFNAFLEYGEQLDENGRQNIHPYILSSLRVDKNLFMASPEDDVRVSNPRTLKKLSDYFYSQTRHGRPWKRQYVAALVSDLVGASMSNIIDNLDRLVGIQELFGNEKDKELNTEALEKFKQLEEFEKYYVISTAINSSSQDEVINFGRKNNVIKLLQLLKEGDVPPETLVSFGTALVNAEKRGVKTKLTQAKWLSDEETNIMGFLRTVRRLTNLIA